jgi:hypothetical protein
MRCTVQAQIICLCDILINNYIFLNYYRNFNNQGVSAVAYP